MSKRVPKVSKKKVATIDEVYDDDPSVDNGEEEYVELEQEASNTEEKEEETPVDIESKLRPATLVASSKEVGEQFRQFFNKLYGNSKFSDIVLILTTPDGSELEKFNAHRSVLSVSSEYLRKLLPNSSGAESKELKLVIERGDLEIMKMMLRYAYTGQLQYVPTEQVPALIAMAYKYGIHALKEQCGEIIAESVTADSVFTFLQMSQEYGGVQSLNAKCAEFLAKNFGMLFKDHPEMLLQLDLDTFSKMLLSSEINVNSEKIVFEAVMKYAERYKKQGKEKLDSVYNKLLPSIRFNLLPMKFVVEELENHKELKHLPLLHQLLHELYKWRLAPYFKTSFITKHRKGLSIHTQFHKNNHGPSVTLSTDGRTATNPAATYEVASGADSFEDGIHIWRLKIGTCVYVGVGVIDTTMTNYTAEFHLQVGCYVYYWSGPGYTNGRSDGNIENFNQGDVITIVLNMSSKELMLVKNGTRVVKRVNSLQGRKTVAVLLRSASSTTLLGEDEESEELTALQTLLNREIDF